MKNEFGQTAGTTADTAVVPHVPPARPTLTLDVSLYERYLAESDMTEEQKHEFLETLWSVIVGFVDLGFGIDPVNQVQNSAGCGEADETDGLDGDSLVSSTNEPEMTGVRTLRAEIERTFHKGGMDE